jgi:hypothetical protein
LDKRLIGISTDEFILLHQGTLEICSMKQSCLLNIDLLDLFHRFCQDDLLLLLFTLFDPFIADLDSILSKLQLWDHWDDLLSYEQSFAQENLIDPKVDSRQRLDRSIDVLLVPSSFNEIELINEQLIVLHISLSSKKESHQKKYFHLNVENSERNKAIRSCCPFS